MSKVEERDLGFGSVIANDRRHRLLNRDGTFNVMRRRGGWRAAVNAYHQLITMSWPRFFCLFALAYLGANAVFALLYMALGAGALEGGAQRAGGFAQAFFFSIQTFATIGYGGITPVSMAANLLVSGESLVSLIAVALGTGIVFARFARPFAHIRFSSSAVIAPYRDRTAFMLRIVNERNSDLVEVQAKVIFSRIEMRSSGIAAREFHQLALERDSVSLFPLTWTVVHPIDEASPLAGVTAASLAESDAEFLVLVSGTEDTFSEVVHARTSYRANEVRVGWRFRSLFQFPTDGSRLRVDISQLDQVEPVASPKTDLA